MRNPPDGASLAYTTPHIPSPLQSLVHASLGVTSLIKREPLKHNVIDRDKILVPPNWDSWGKIRVLREGFDVETVSNGWADDIRQDWPLAPTSNGYRRGDEDGDPFTSQESDVDRHQQELSALTHYEDWVPDASAGGLQLTEPGSSDPMRLEVVSDDPQKFLLDQGKLLDMLKVKSEESEKAGASGTPTRSGKKPADDLDLVRAGAVGSIVSDHIGPVQFNMGGIQVDADDMVQRLKVCLPPFTPVFPSFSFFSLVSLCTSYPPY